MRRATISYATANRCAVTRGLFLLRTRINTAILFRRIRFLRTTFIRGRIGALTDHMLASLILFLGNFLTATRAYFHAGLGRFLSSFWLVARSVCLVW